MVGDRIPARQWRAGFRISGNFAHSLLRRENAEPRPQKLRSTQVVSSDNLFEIRIVFYRNGLRVLGQAVWPQEEINDA
jgi:hypothetical protein